MINKLTAALAASLLLALALPAAAQQAAQQPGSPIRLRGTIDAVAGDTLTMTTREGEHATLKMSDKTTVASTVLVPLADLKEGTYVGTSAETGPNGELLAIEVHIIPQGANPGQRPYDLTPTSTMTNGALANIQQQADQSKLMTIKYEGGEHQLLVKSDTPIVTSGPGDRSLLVAGAWVVVNGRKLDDGSMTANSIRAETNGVKPPM